MTLKNNSRVQSSLSFAFVLSLYIRIFCLPTTVLNNRSMERKIVSKAKWWGRRRWVVLFVSWLFTRWCSLRSIIIILLRRSLFQWTIHISPSPLCINKISLFRWDRFVLLFLLYFVVVGAELNVLTLQLPSLLINNRISLYLQFFWTFIKIHEENYNYKKSVFHRIVLGWFDFSWVLFVDVIHIQLHKRKTE